ncbi:MAG: VCBS repeat-containing protein [Rhizobiales bacterium]|nr:VCBS repeat-containing protein [Hyphomicrobiales bacterium]
MPLNLIFVSPGNYSIEDNGIPGDNTSVIRDSNGVIIFTFANPADALGFTVSTPGVNLKVNLTDTLGAANLTIGDLASAAVSPDSITIAGVRTTGIVTLVANGAITELGSDTGADIVAGQVIISANTGVGTGNAIETQASIIEAETNTGDINISNFGAVQIGGASADVSGLYVATSGNINLTNVGTILLGDDTGAESVHGGGTSGNVTLKAIGTDSDILATVDNDAITVSHGNLVLQADRDIGFGIIGSNFDNDVRAYGSITINAGRDFLIDGFADLASDDFLGNTGGGVTITAGRNIHVRSVAGTDGSIFANGTAGADVILTTGANGALVVGPASIRGAPQPIASNSGDVIVNADRILINSASGIGALSGQVTLDPATVGREINLGSAGDAAFALELSDAEIDRIFTPTLNIGNDLAGQITVSAAISPANATNLVLRSGADIAVQAAITTSGSLELRAGDNVFLTSSPTITVGGALTISVDTLGNDGGAGGVVYLGNASVSATSIAINGAGENDTLGGFESVDQTVHGNGGNDTINSSGEGHYFGDAGNDLMLAGLSSGIVPEVLDGGIGVDTVDTRSFNGSYTINLATGVTNFAYESFVNFENVTTGDGSDQITGTAGDNIITTNGDVDTIQAGAGNDTLNGGAGNDILNGGTGIDTAIFSGSRASYTLTNLGTAGLRVVGPDGTDTLTSIEKLQFADQTIAWQHPQSDFGDDGISDILWQSTTGQIAIWQMNSAGKQGSGTTAGSLASSWHVGDTGDFNADGKADILWHNDNGQTMIWTMNGGQHVGTLSLGSLATTWQVQGAVDFNGDGASDILWRNSANGNLVVWNMDSAGQVTSTTNLGIVSSAYHIQALDDFNGDGKDDILWRNDNGQIALWQMNESGVSSASTIGTLASTWHIQGSGDFNGDSKADILWRSDAGQIAIWSMNGAQVTDAATVGTLNSAWQVETIGDYNGDGKDDILWRNSATGQAADWLMDGSHVTAMIDLGKLPTWDVAHHQFDIV